MCILDHCSSAGRNFMQNQSCLYHPEPLCYMWNLRGLNPTTVSSTLCRQLGLTLDLFLFYHLVISLTVMPTYLYEYPLQTLDCVSRSQDGGSEELPWHTSSTGEDTSLFPNRRFYRTAEGRSWHHMVGGTVVNQFCLKAYPTLTRVCVCFNIIIKTVDVIQHTENLFPLWSQSADFQL